jgi:hypothetical protein
MATSGPSNDMTAYRNHGWGAANLIVGWDRNPSSPASNPDPAEIRPADGTTRATTAHRVAASVGSTWPQGIGFDACLPLAHTGRAERRWPPAVARGSREQEHRSVPSGGRAPHQPQGIEALHHIRDTTFAEDASQLRLTSP